jgi:hypothetical protein
MIFILPLIYYIFFVAVIDFIHVHLFIHLIVYLDRPDSHSFFVSHH